MSIIRRSKRNTTFVQIDKTPLRDNTISWKAKGLLAYLLSLPDDWQIYTSELVNHSTDGKDSTRSGMTELIEAGYIKRKQQKIDGKFAGYVYTVYEIPEPEKPQRKNRSGYSVNGKPVNGKSATTNKDNTNKEITNKERQITNSDELEVGFPVFFIEMTNEEILNHMKIVIDRLPEANIQAEFFHRCRNEGIKCILEYTYSGCRFDALVYDDNKNVLAIIEFKSYKTNKAPKTNTKQIDKYKKFGLPIIMVTRFEDVSWSISEVKKLINKDRPSAKKEKVRLAQDAIEFLNHLAGREFASNPKGEGRANGQKNIDKVVKLLNQKYSLDDIKLVVEYKTFEWKGNERMEKYLQPSTIFGNKFSEYLQNAEMARDNPRFRQSIQKAKRAERKGVDPSLPQDIIENIKNF